MKLKYTFPILICVMILNGCLTDSLKEFTAPTKSPTPEIKKISFENKTFLFARINTTDFKLKIIENKNQDNVKTINEILSEHSGALAFNGSFFGKDFEPLGLLISENRIISPLNKSELMNGIFTINKKDQPQLFDFETFQTKQKSILPTINFAIQSGPILLDKNGNIAIDKKNTLKAGRTALGLDKNNDLIVLMLRQSLLNRENAMTLYEFAKIATEHKEFENMGIHSLINLDGGNSSGIATNQEYFPEMGKIQHAIIAINKKE